MASLITEDAVKKILPILNKSIQNKKKIIFIFGEDMPNPSSPKALKVLFKLHDNKYFKLLRYEGPEFFHSKLFIFIKNQTYNIFLGSSNLSVKGFTQNIEFNCLIKNIKYKDKIIKKIMKSIKNIEDNSSPITQQYIDIYEKMANAIKTKNKNMLKEINIINNKNLSQQLERDKNKWEKLIKKAKEFKNTIKYKERKEELKIFRKKLNKVIRSFKTPHVNKKLWSNKNEVGYFSNLDERQYKKTIPNTKYKLRRLNKTLRYLFNENIDIETRINNVVPSYGKYHINGMGIGHVTDILNKFKPEKYPLVNEPIIVALKYYGIRYLPSDKDKLYNQVISIYEKIRKEANYPEKEGYALIDRFMWEKGHKILYC